MPLTSERLGELSDLARDNPSCALMRLREYEVEFPLDPGLLMNRGGLLVDIGSDLGKPDLVQRTNSA